MSFLATICDKSPLATQKPMLSVVSTQGSGLGVHESEPLRVLQVFGSLNRGGAEAMMMGVYRSADRERIQFDFVCHRPGPWHHSEEIESLGGRIFVAPRYRLWNHRLYVHWWHTFLAEHSEWPVIHGHMMTTAALYLKVARTHGRRTVSHAHNTRFGGWVIHRVKRLLHRGIPRYADVLLACSHSAGDAVFGAGTAYRVIHNGIDIERYVSSTQVRDDVRSEIGLEDHLVLGHVGRMNAQKNHAFLLEAFAVLHRMRPDAVLLLVGDGSLRRQLELQCSALGITGQVHFLGVRADVHRLLQAMDVFVLPSRFEGLPVALVEAQASGLPVLVSSAVSREVQIIPELEFMDLDEGAEAWAARLLEMTDTHVRRDTRLDLQRAGYDIRQVSQSLCSVYFELAQGLVSTASKESQSR